MPVQVVTPPVSEPVFLDDVLTHLGDVAVDQDYYIGGLIAAARSHVEQVTRRQLVTATLKLTLDCFPCGPIFVPRPRLRGVNSIKYIDPAGNQQVWPDAEYQVDVVSEPGRISPAYGKSWPCTRPQFGAVEIEYPAGYGTPYEIPESIIEAMYLLISHWNENRETVLVGTISKPVEFAVDALLAPYRVTDNRVLEFV